MSGKKSLFINLTILGTLVGGSIGSAWAGTLNSNLLSQTYNNSSTTSFAERLQGAGKTASISTEAITTIQIDTDSDGLPDEFDLCPDQIDAWYLVPTDWVGNDGNGIEDATELYESVRETLDGESAVDANNAVDSLNDSVISFFTYSVDDLAEELSAITLVHVLDDGADYVYDEISGVNSKLRAAHKKRAGNYGTTYTYDPSSLEDAVTDRLDGEGEAETVEFAITTATDFSGVIQKECDTASLNADVIIGDADVILDDTCEEEYETCMAEADDEIDEFICEWFYEHCE